jgi:hypothetical protein
LAKRLPGTAVILKTEATRGTVTDAVGALLSRLAEPQRGTSQFLFAEMDAMETTEARLYKAWIKWKRYAAQRERIST